MCQLHPKTPAGDQANIAALRATDAALAARLANLDGDGGLVRQASRCGLATATVRTADGRELWLHSRYDPAAEAKAQADAVVRKDALCYVVCGGGLGYLAAELLARLPGEAAVVVAESHLPTLSAALELHDFSADIRRGRMTFITATDTAHCHSRLHPHDGAILGGVQFANSPTADRIDGPFYAAVRTAVADYVAFARTALMTTLAHNETTARNIAANMPHYLAAAEVGILRDRFAGRPAVIVSAGPSLQKNLARLKAAADRVIIIAVQTTLRVLLEAGIQPHFVTSLDYHEISERFFQDLPAEALGEVTLVAEPKANYRVIDAFVARAGGGPGGTRVMLLGNEFADSISGCPPSRHQRLPGGATVAHLAFYLAQHIGCDPIIFIGQDLGFSNHTYYTPGTAIHRAWAGELNRYNSIESMEWQRIARSRNLLRKLTDVHGRPIYTEEQLYIYLQQFQRDFATAGQRIIDATGGGVAKAGAQIMDFDEAIAKFAPEPLPAELLDWPNQVNWFDPSRADEAEQYMSDLAGVVGELADLCRRTLKLLGRLAELLETDPAEFNRMIERLNELRAEVGRRGPILDLVCQVSPFAVFHRFQADRAVRLGGTDGVEKRRLQLGRDRPYVAAIEEGCNRLMEILSLARERLTERIRH